MFSDREDYVAALSIIREYAERGDIGAQAHLALGYVYDGQEEEGLRWYRRVTEGSDADALLKIGYDYLTSDSYEYHYPATTSVNMDAYLWMTLGVGRYSNPGSPIVEAARHDLDDLMRLMGYEEIRAADDVYYKLIAGDATAQRYHVREAQQLLERLGYSPGPVDGKWGPRSDKAFTEWLKQARLKTTGQEFTVWMKQPGLDNVPYGARHALRAMRAAVLGLK